ncbi:UDP-glucose dehydrogenase family protein [Aureimonas mangrovi]|uniref:UDP-glucose dehydrogenase family protein n=1 Tax=Aureimonas mangrovi TaxID=2758041 RepID=UPI00163DD4EA|nr:UDP-glucose/GDP-mannose dehydrogenase family protein [Aureimonas mangrovi]
MKITVFGTGYVGLVQGAVLAGAGHEVLCIDNDPKKIEGLKRGVVPIHEPGLEALVTQCVAEGLLHFSTDAQAGVAFSQVQMIAVGTPPDEDGSADLRHVLAVARTIATHMAEPKVFVVKSTVPVGTSARVTEAAEAVLSERGRSSLAVAVVSNPEFLKEGAAVADCTRPDRIIVGCEDDAALEILRELYAPFNRNHEKMIVMDVRSAELTKYAANCMLATRISFMNEIANLAEIVGADIEQVRRGIGSDPRIGYHFIYPGIGYGGSCFPKDIAALIRTAEGVEYEPFVLKAVHQRNEAQKSVLFDKVAAYFGGDLAGRRIALWGLAFKPDTEDMREASSRVLMEALWAAGASVQAYDPVAMEECQRIYGERADLTLCGTKEAALKGADALLIATEWKMFRAPAFETIAAGLTNPVIFDGRNLYEPAIVARHGLEYHSIGRRPAHAEAGRREKLSIVR